MFDKSLREKVIIISTFSDDYKTPKVLKTFKKAGFNVNLHNEFNNGPIFLE